MSKVKSLKFATEVSNNIAIRRLKLHHNSVIKVYVSCKVYDRHLNTIFQAAITILRIDDLIKLEPEKGEEKSYQQAYADGSLEG